MAVNGVEIEVGQVWATRNGYSRKVVAVAAKGDGAYPVVLDNGDTVRTDGHCSPFGREDSADLIRLMKIAPPVTEDIRIPEPRTMFDAKPIDMTAQGYECLANVLQLAYNQAAVGKGVERHAAVGEPFHQQVMQIGAAKFGVGALLFQAFKKSEESQRLEHDRAVNELLGAIVYLAGAVIALEKAKASK